MSNTFDLLPQSEREQIPPLYSQEHNPDPMVYVRFFFPGSRWTWYITEFDPQEEECFGYVVGDEAEMGYFSLQELQALSLPVQLKLVDKKGKMRASKRMRLHVKRDIHFRPQPLSQVKARHR